MEDNEIIKEIRKAREEMLRAHDGDFEKLANSLMERQKQRPNLVSIPPKDQVLAEDKPAQAYNAKN
ncbi:MAG: hypothetical protein ACNA77_03000 [Opitutales bacterium]